MSERMTSKEHKKWEAYIRQVADILHLKDWDITFARGEPKDGGVADFCPAHGRKWGAIHLDSTFLAEPQAEQVQTITHEVIHAHFAPLREFVRTTLQREMGQSAYDVFMKAFDDFLEYGVDGLADGVAPLLPLPPKG